ncbi:MAG: hypothetical protein M3409_02560 [Gemmatimonadota bacterium]|nr:hypothetical protein [Gemmatimonadota bacterium]
MALFNRDYDRDYGNRGTAGGYNAGPARGYDRDMGDRMRGGWNNLKGETRETLGMGYDRDYGNRGFGDNSDRDYRFRGTPGGRVGGGLAYDRGYNTSGMGGYDRDYGNRGKSRMQTDQGDPFNDRSRNTPIRVMRGEYEGYDRNFRGNQNNQNMNRGYDRDFDNRGYSAGVGYDPYDNPTNNTNRGGAPGGRQNMNRGYGRGYDNGMF